MRALVLVLILHDSSKPETRRAQKLSIGPERPCMSRFDPLTNTVLLPYKSLLVEVLDEEKNVVTRATGFALQENQALFLYTCWHVVTGVNFLQPATPRSKRRRASLVLHSHNVVEEPAVRHIEGGHSIDVPLYDEMGEPRWLQDPNEREQPDLNLIGIRLPQLFDLVRIPIKVSPEIQNLIEFKNADVIVESPYDGDDVVVIGYPHGYSAWDASTPLPVFLKRSIACSRPGQVGRVLLDSGAAPGMSGAPVLKFQGDRWGLVGMYTGVIFPDYQRGGHTPANRFALGLMVPLFEARVLMHVPGIDEGLHVVTHSDQGNADL